MPRRSMILLLAMVSTPALAQQTAANLVTQADDAFGRAVGNERIGIYSNEEVRGFNPIEAGNVRLEGLYIEEGTVSPPRLNESLAVRVGYGARGIAFPAPTGIVDFRMEKFSGTERYNAELEIEGDANIGGAIEAKIPLSGDRLGLALGLGARSADQVNGRNGKFTNWLAGLAWLPQTGSEFILFTSGAQARSAEFAASLFPAGSFVPPQQPRKLQQTQPWAQNRFLVTISGGIAKFPLGDFRIEAGLFRSTRHDPENYFTLLLGVGEDGSVRDHVVIADTHSATLSTSGEFRVTRTWTGDKLRHSLIASVRGRLQDRIFGGQHRVSLGASQAGEQDFLPKPAFVFGADDHAQVRQLFYGLQYQLQALNGSTASLAVQKVSYRKRTDFANALLADTVSRDAPWLFSATASLALLPGLTAYGGYVRGMEESAVAPDIASNRSEAPPALRTRQMDAGLRYAITPHLAVIAGVFDIRKPYFGVDAALRFGNLGTVANRGAELSVAGTLAQGLTLVAGGILVDPKISGPEVAAGRIGPRPIGSFRKRGIFNLDWKPAGQEAWSFDLALEGLSPEAANRLNTFSAPARSNLNLGARYRFAWGQTKFLVRGQVLNLLNSYGWKVNSSGGFGFTQPRMAMVQLFADY